MALLSATETPVFATGVLFGALLLCLGLGIGIWIGRRTTLSDEGRRPASDDQVLAFLRRLFQWMSGFASDVSQYREVVDRVSQRFSAVDGESIADDEATAVNLLTQIIQANEQFEKRLDNAETVLKHQASELAASMSEARTDTLTGLPNRRVFDDELARRIAEWRRHETPVSVLLVDIDHFKSFNDRYGHLAGDAVLGDVARVLRQTVRESDLVARFGGEEFAVILPSSQVLEACQAAERIRLAIDEALFRYEGQPLHVTVSCGTAQAKPNEDASALLKRADKALYASKSAGRNAAHWHEGRKCVSIAKQPENDQRSGSAEETGYDSPPANDDFGQMCDDLRRRLLEITQQES